MNSMVRDDGGTVRVLALVASAGGLEALISVLRDLPADVPAAVVVQQHLSPGNGGLASILQHRTGRKTGWAVEGAKLRAGLVSVCPAGMRMEMRPDGSCTVIAEGSSALDMPHDALLRSLADVHRARAVAVVLSGMGRDGAAGAAAMKAAGGFVIAQSEETARYSSMPRAAGMAAHLILPVGEIGTVLGHVLNDPCEGIRPSCRPCDVYRTSRPVRQEMRDHSAMADDGEDAYQQLAHQARARGERAARRAGQAQKRADELRTYFQALREGRDPPPPVDESSIARAREQAEESARRSAQAHREAAASHELAAGMHERAVRQVPGQAQHHRREAQRHREQAAMYERLSFESRD